MRIKQIILKIIYGYSTSDQYVDWLRQKGVTIGTGTRFYSPHHTDIDITRPYGVSIGNNVHITRNVTILTHGFDWCVLKEKYNDVLGSFGEVEIGNNVFIGSGTMILKGVHIGDDIIIGARSLLTHDCIKSGVYSGSPAKYVCSIDEYYTKRINDQYKEAKQLVKCYYKRYKKIPPKSCLDEFFFLFEDRNNELLDCFQYQMKNNGKYDECLLLFKSEYRKMFKNYNEFINSCEVNDE